MFSPYFVFFLFRNIDLMYACKNTLKHSAVLKHKHCFMCHHTFIYIIHHSVSLLYCTRLLLLNLFCLNVSGLVFPSQDGWRPGGITDQQWFPVGPLVVVARTDGLMKCICKRAYTKAVERSHGICTEETHKAPIRAGKNPNTLELPPS